MKLVKIILAILFTALVISCSDKSSNGNEPEITDYSDQIAKLIPLEVGKSFSYKVDTLENNSSNYVEIGQRTFSVDKIDGNYIECSEIYSYLQGLNLKTKFKLTENSIEIMADTNGTSNLIPDSLSIPVKLELNETFKVVQFPLEENSTWEVFKAYAIMGTAKFNVFTLTAQYLGNETISLSNSEQSQAHKFEYSITINIPNLNNFMESNIQTYNANVWIAENIGIVKLEGCAMFINSMTGNSFNMSDTNKSIQQTLIYSE